MLDGTNYEITKSDFFYIHSDTSRKPKKGERESRMYAFTSRSKMEAEIKNGRFLEYGEFEGNLYGLKIDSIHEVVEAGRICILDANPQVGLFTKSKQIADHGGRKPHKHIRVGLFHFSDFRI